MTDPSPFAQTAVYMLGIAVGYTLLMRPDEWQRAWETVRDVFSKRP